MHTGDMVEVSILSGSQEQPVKHHSLQGANTLTDYTRCNTLIHSPKITYTAEVAKCFDVLDPKGQNWGVPKTKWPPASH